MSYLSRKIQKVLVLLRNSLSSHEIHKTERLPKRLWGIWERQGVLSLSPPPSGGVLYPAKRQYPGQLPPSPPKLGDVLPKDSFSPLLGYTWGELEEGDGAKEVQQVFLFGNRAQNYVSPEITRVGF